MTENEKIDKFVEERDPEELVSMLALFCLWLYGYRCSGDGDLERLAKAFEAEGLVFSKDDVRLAEWLEKVSEFLKENQELIGKLAREKGYD